MAGIGPLSMVTGSTPTMVEATMRARGLAPSRFTPASEARISAAAPSEIWDEVRAVCTPPSSTGWSWASFSSEDFRSPSSRVRIWVSPVGLRASSRTGASIGTTSRS